LRLNSSRRRPATAPAAGHSAENSPPFLGGYPYQAVTDPREPAKITYPLATLLWVGAWMYLCRLKARRQVGLLLRNGPATANCQALWQVATVPHGDTLNAAFGRLQPAELQEVVCARVERLIRNKVLEPYRLFERFYVVAIDGTQMLTFPQRHCKQCLTRTHNGHTTYYHTVLEAKLVTPNGFAFSLMTEFIENPEPNPSKQDCELKAFYRLAAKLKKRFPRLPILLTLDGLFAGGPTFALCVKSGWPFMVVLKDADLPSVNQEFQSLWPLQPQDALTCLQQEGADEVKQSYRWVNRIPYVDTERRQHTLNVLECLETKRGKEGQLTTTKFQWVTDQKITANNVLTLAQGAGRIRWKVENEGFNVQKNGGFGLEHAYTTDWIAAQIFYFLLQIAHLIAQLVERGSLLKKAFPRGLGSAKNLAFRLLEAWRNTCLHPQDWWKIQHTRCQIRFDTS